MSLPIRNNKKSISIFEMCIFAMLAAIMFCFKIVMEAFPNIHPLGALTMAYTVAYRSRALIPIYLYVILNGIFCGFATWWWPYLYVWAILWGMTMIIPKHIPDKIAAFVYPMVCCLHGLLFGVLYAPVQALMFGFNLEQMLAWIAAGFPFDVIHGISNFAVGFLILPTAKLLAKLKRQSVN